ncbi:MAG: trypsin-like peptidase domain-containing protein [Thermomicrobium sp.]|nr:trypsin-like peptidase domain-containing protein [Thermomicrobium sp.]
MRSIRSMVVILGLLCALVPVGPAQADEASALLPAHARPSPSPGAPDPLAALLERAGYSRVFPPDERTRVTPTTTYPASAIALLVGQFPDGTLYTCSGAAIAPALVLTTAHCLYSAEFGGWFSRLRVVPGADRTLDGLVTPFGISEAVDASVPRGWVERGEEERYDFGVVQLDQPVGDRTGTLPLAPLDERTVTDPGFEYFALGYPGDKPLGTQWRAPGQGVALAMPEVLSLQADLVRGMSGGPLVTVGEYGIFGIVSAERSLWNYARRVDEGVVEFARTLCQELCCTVRVLAATQPAPQPAVPLAFTRVEPTRWSTVLPGSVRVAATIAARYPLAELVVRVAGQEARSTEPSVSLDVWLSPGRYTVTALARDVVGNQLLTMWDIVVSWDLGDGVWFDSRGQPKAEEIEATARALVEAFRWHLYGMSWDGRDHRGDMPTHAERILPGEPVPDLVTDRGFDRAATEATLRALVEAFRWHLYGASWDGLPHQDMPTHAASLR